MLARLLLMVFCALIIVITTAITIKNSDPNTTQDFTELTHSTSSILRLLEREKLKKTIVVDFSAGEFNLRPPKPCECSANNLKQALVSFKGLDPPFLHSYRGSKAQTINFPDQILDSAACRRADDTSMCGRLLYTFTDLESRLEIPNFPHKGIYWDATMNQVTLKPQKTDPTGLHKVLVTAYLPSFKDVLETAEIAYFVHPAPEELPPNEEKPEPQDTGQPRKLLPVYKANCTNPTTMLNLFNTAAIAEQSSFYDPGTAITGCDGEVMMIDRATYNQDINKLVTTSNPVTPDYLQFWKITFSQPTSIKTTLFIDRDDVSTGRFKFYVATVGNDPDVTKNPECVPLGAMADGGWYPCPNSMIGSTFGVYSNSEYVNFVEAMAYSQEAIHYKASVTVSILGTVASGYPASNAIQKFVVLEGNDLKQKCVIISPPAGGLATQRIKFQAQTLIKAVVLLPGYRTVPVSDWVTHQITVAIYGKTVGETYQQCGVTGNYYATTYSEVSCNIKANAIILEQQNAAYDLRFCGFGALADCDCGQSSFDRLLFTTPPATPFASTTLIQVKSTDGVQQIQLNLLAPDTISSVCGNADGFTKCGTRQLSFKDKLTGFLISYWPYRGYSFDAVTSKLTLDAAQADLESVITVTISLQNYPTVFMSQDITAVVYGGKTAATVTEGKKVATATKGIETFQPCIPSEFLDAAINEEAFLELPALPETSYSVSSLQEFSATFDANLLKVLSSSESDVGTKFLQVSKISPTLNCTSKVKISFRSNNNKQSSGEGSASNTTSQALKISEVEQKDLLKKVVCHVDQAKEVTCVNPANGFKFYYDPPSQKLISGSRNHSDLRTQEEKIVSLTISRINSKGEVTFLFSEDVNVEALANTSDTTGARRLRSKESKSKSNTSTQSEASKQRYLLSSEHLNITLNHTSDVNGSLINNLFHADRINFEWYAKKITPDSIVIQFVFKNPLLISSQVGFQDKLGFQLLPPSFQYFTSLKTGQLIEDPLRNVTRVLPTQVELGLTMQYIEEAAQTIQTVGQSSVASNVAMQVILSGSFNQMWSMVNAMQITISFNQMELPMPGNVNVVMGYASDLADFNVFPTQTILDYLFKFSDTDLPGVGFESLGTTVKNLVLYLGSQYLLMNLMILIYLFYSFTIILSKYACLCKCLEAKLMQNLIWQYLLTFLIESYFSFAVGILLRFEEPKFYTTSDQYDFALACVFCLVVILLPLISYLLLCKNESKLDQKVFKQKFGSFYSGLATNSSLKRKYCMLMMSWFLLRRLMTAINLVLVRHETKFAQITINILLCLIDACLKLHWDPFESKINGNIQKMNDLVVLFMSEFMFCFTDLIRSEEDKYLIGWIYLGIFGYLVWSNIIVMVLLASKDVFKALKRKIFIRRRDEILKRNKERKQIRDLAESCVKGNAKELKRAMNRIWLKEAQEERERHKKEEREMRQKQQALAITRQNLEQISEVDEDKIEESSRKSQISQSASSIQSSQVSSSGQSESAYQSDRVSQPSKSLRELPGEPEEIDMASLMREASKKQSVEPKETEWAVYLRQYQRKEQDLQIRYSQSTRATLTLDQAKIDLKKSNQNYQHTVKSFVEWWEAWQASTQNIKQQQLVEVKYKPFVGIKSSKKVFEDQARAQNRQDI